MKANFVQMRDYAKMPTKGSEYAAGYDVYACIDEPVKIPAHETVKIPIGIAIQPPHGYFVAIFARSGLATKESLRPANCVGVGDEDYRGEYIVALHNDSERIKTVNPEDRIAQIVFLPYINVEFNLVDKLTDTDRGTGGFGSSGK